MALDPTAKEFNWRGHSWSIRPAEPMRPDNGEYLLQPHGADSWIPMNIRLLLLHLGISQPPAKHPPLNTIISFLELTGQVDIIPLPTILDGANSLRNYYPR